MSVRVGWSDQAEGLTRRRLVRVLCAGFPCPYRQAGSVAERADRALCYRRPTKPSPARSPLVCRRNSLEPQSSSPSLPARHPRAAPARSRARTPPRVDRRAAAASQPAACSNRLPVCRRRRRDPLVYRRLQLDPQRPSPPEPAHHPRVAADCAVARRAPAPTAAALLLPCSLTRARAVCLFAAATGAIRKPGASWAHHDAAHQPPTGRWQARAIRSCVYARAPPHLGTRHPRGHCHLGDPTFRA